MSPERLQALLSAYAAGTLTEADRSDLFALALERQDVFDQLLQEEPLREVLHDPAARARIESALALASAPGRKPRRKLSWAIRRPIWAIAAMLGVVAFGGFLTYRLRQPAARQVPVSAKLEVPKQATHELAPLPPPPSAPVSKPAKQPPRQNTAPRLKKQVPVIAPPKPAQQVAAASAAREPESPRREFAAGAIGGVPGSLVATPATANLPPGTAMRVSLHAAGGSTFLDSHSPISADSSIQVNVTVPGYIAIIEEGPGLERAILATGERLFPAGASVRQPLADFKGTLHLKIIYSVTALAADDIDRLLRGPAAIIGETHSGTQKVLLATPPPGSRAIVVTLPIEVR